MGRPSKGLLLSRKCLRELERYSQEAKGSQNTDVVVRVQGVVLVSEGWNYRETAHALGVTSGTVSNWISRYLHGGAPALATKRRSGRPPKLSEEQLCSFEEIIDAGAMAYGFPNDLWDANRAAKVIWECFTVSHHPHHVAKILHQRGFSVQRPAVALAKADQEAQKRWEKEDKPRIARRAKKNEQRSSSKMRSV